MLLTPFILIILTAAFVNGRGQKQEPPPDLSLCTPENVAELLSNQQCLISRLRFTLRTPNSQLSLNEVALYDSAGAYIKHYSATMTPKEQTCGRGAGCYTINPARNCFDNNSATFCQSDGRSHAATLDIVLCKGFAQLRVHVNVTAQYRHRQSFVGTEVEFLDYSETTCRSFKITAPSGTYLLDTSAPPKKPSCVAGVTSVRHASGHHICCASECGKCGESEGNCASRPAGCCAREIIGSKKMQVRQKSPPPPPPPSRLEFMFFFMLAA